MSGEFPTFHVAEPLVDCVAVERSLTFIFLSEDEYKVLAVKDKAAYLVRAQQELDASQQQLRRLMEELRKEQFGLQSAAGSQ